MHLLGDSVDIENNTHATTFKDMDIAYSNVSPLQLTHLVEEGVNYLQSSYSSSKEDIDMLQPVSKVRLLILLIL